jgi:hypothetical protein
MKRLLIIWACLVACDTVDDFNTETRYFLKYVGGEGSQEAADIEVDADGNFYVLGTSTLDPVRQISKIYLAKTDARGNLIREQIFFNESGNNTRYVAKDLLFTTAGELVVLGVKIGTATADDVFVMKVDPNGLSILVENTITFTQGPPNSIESPNAISETADGFLVIGSTNNVSLKQETVLGDLQDILIVRLDLDLQSFPQNSWTQAYGPGTEDGGVCGYQVNPNQFHFFASSNKQKAPGNDTTNFFIFQLNAAGLPLGVDFRARPRPPAEPNALVQHLEDVVLREVGLGSGYLLAGMSGSPGGNGHLVTVKLASNLGSADTDYNPPLVKLTDRWSVNERNVRVANSSSGFLVVANQNQDNIPQRDVWLARLDRDGALSPTMQPVLLGGEFDDIIGNVRELGDGSIALVSTFGVGGNQKKIALIKVNAQGKFSD